eukprot:180115-Chlamydomonas_euryale.AAC.3
MQIACPLRSPNLTLLATTLLCCNQRCGRKPRPQSRANGIDRLHKALVDVRSSAILRPQLSEFVSFLMSLVQDPNFKIAMSSLQILGELIAKVGRDIEPQIK